MTSFGRRGGMRAGTCLSKVLCGFGIAAEQLGEVDHPLYAVEDGVIGSPQWMGK
jgi:hypothetical protein